MPENILSRRGDFDDGSAYWIADYCFERNLLLNPSAPHATGAGMEVLPLRPPQMKIMLTLGNNSGGSLRVG